MIIIGIGIFLFVVSASIFLNGARLENNDWNIYTLISVVILIISLTIIFAYILH